MNTTLLGVDIGGTKCAVVLGALNGDRPEIRERIAFPTDTTEGPEAVLARIEAETRGLLQRHGLGSADIQGLGISCGGPLDSQCGRILGPPNLPGWDDVPITAHFVDCLGIPCSLQNDADACALAEWRWGAGRGCRNMVFLTFGTGMGAGLILNGRLYSGACGLAGEVGHVRLTDNGPHGYGKDGSFEGWCSGGGIADAAQRAATAWHAQGKDSALLSAETISTQAVFLAAHAGDPLALEIVRQTARQLGTGLAMLIDILNPECIVIGSIFTRQQALLWPIAEEIIRAEALPASAQRCRVLPAALGEAIGDYACLMVALGEGYHAA